MTTQLWVITGIDAGESVYWSNSEGWVTQLEDAERFESTDYNLPLGESVAWREVSS